MKYFLLGASALALAACGQDAGNDAAETPSDVAGKAGDDAEAKGGSDVAMEELTLSAEALDTALAKLDDDAKARFEYRHPKETLMFFGVEPGMTVVDTLSGNPWYAGILIDYLGADGKVIGADYSPEMWTNFGNFSPDPATKATWVEDWTARAEGWRDEETDAAVGAVQFGNVPDEMAGTVDVVMQIRSFHHFHRLEDEGEFMTEALADMMKMLKPGGHVGVVLHRAPEDSSDEWATGDSGYVKQSAVIAAFEGAGFELAKSSEINANPKDQPTEQDFVWRLPPTLATSQDNDELRAEMQAIGESDRMTLLFRKPA